jgi:hypothetical protein
MKAAKGIVAVRRMKISPGWVTPSTWMRLKEAIVEKRPAGGMKVPTGMTSSQKSSKKKATERPVVGEPVHRDQKKPATRGLDNNWRPIQNLNREKTAKKNSLPPARRTRTSQILP